MRQVTMGRSLSLTLAWGQDSLEWGRAQKWRGL